MSARGPLLSRVLAILAAVFLVGAFALALSFPPSLSLARLVARIDHPALVAFERWVEGHLGDQAWLSVCVPVLARPAWLLPLGLGIVFAGLAVTVGSGRRVPRSPGWRN